MPSDAHPTHDFSALVAAIRQTDAALAAQASRAVNVSLMLRNWFIGHYIAEFELQGADRARYGDNLIAELARALRAHAISNRGKHQLYAYLAFYRTYPQIVRTASAQSAQVPSATLSDAKVRTAPALSSTAPAVDADRLIGGLSYSHLEQLVELSDPLQRRFYEAEALRGQWSVRELKRQIATQYYERSSLSSDKDALSVHAHTAAERATPQQVIRDPYIFEFLGLKPQEAVTEGQLEDALLDKLQAFLLELGHGFCYEARQKRLLIGGEHFFVDLVFYHRILKCHVLIELKNDAFRHEHLGQLNAYVSYYKRHEMSEGDQPPIGILLCTRKNTELVQYALADMSNQLFVSRYQVQLPDKEEMAAFLHKAVEELGGANA
ncbi:PDDEXK nuclease domain-containing protein [Acidovorax sp. SUPP2522]|uniref:PDDEXK nuclease domain-containing protein n=2 Tax=unclassified Acidovorax TaxID=2684926 RepID=UPI0023DE1AF1|nr:PDDEXK nuclease domain-containing protein [Acidovorax sp. SUPP2522]GKT13405.1 PDDEXK nuclease domain-containing protein [Acidovorax sp. SUPP2522]